MADEATAMALNVREMHFSINRSLVLIYMKTNNLAFIRYLNKNEVVKSYLIVFFSKKTMMVHIRIIVHIGRLTKFQAQQKSTVAIDD